MEGVVVFFFSLTYGGLYCVLALPYTLTKFISRCVCHRAQHSLILFFLVAVCKHGACKRPKTAFLAPSIQNLPYWNSLGLFWTCRHYDKNWLEIWQWWRQLRSARREGTKWRPTFNLLNLAGYKPYSYAALYSCERFRCRRSITLHWKKAWIGSSRKLFLCVMTNFFARSLLCFFRYPFQVFLSHPSLCQTEELRK